MIQETHNRPKPIIDSLVDYLNTKNNNHDFHIVRDPIERGILVGEAVSALLSCRKNLGVPLIMKSELDEHGAYDVDVTDDVNNGIAIGLGLIESGEHTSLRSVTKKLICLSRQPISTSYIRTIDDYTAVELAHMQSDHEELAILFPVPEPAIRFEVLGFERVII